MSTKQNQKNLIEESNKFYDNCVNFEKCKGKWFKYKAKDDNGFCKACLKNEKLKEMNLKRNDYYNKLFDCKGTC